MNLLQHMSDLKMLECVLKRQHLRIHPTGRIIRVNLATDESTLHEQFRFMWAARHLCTGIIATLITARNSGSNYLNSVELTNGCLALAHANLCIPSTLGGSCINGNKLNKDKYTENMDLATEVYMNRVNGCPCGKTNIISSKSTTDQDNRKYSLIFLEGTRAEKKALKRDKPSLYAYCEQVW